MSDSDRRQYPRYITDLSAYCYKIHMDGNNESYLAKIKGCIGNKDGEVIEANKVTDISKGGLFLATIAAFCVDTIVVVELFFPEEQDIISTVGVVKWTLELKGDHPYSFGLGIQFLYVKKTEWAKLEKYFGQLKPYEI
ncbi:MAG: PilZ domain-containing protein [Candidatus Ancaeobacter aquaticus]|nr:PilZ domain-containing protein [Candidatus Ancaeobacter aquaticus]